MFILRPDFHLESCKEVLDRLQITEGGAAVARTEAEQSISKNWSVLEVCKIILSCFESLKVV